MKRIKYMLRRFHFLFGTIYFRFKILVSVKIIAGWLRAALLPTPVRAVARLSILDFTSAFHLSRLWLCMTLWHRGEYRHLSPCLFSGCLPAVPVPMAGFHKGLGAWITEMLKWEEESQANVYWWVKASVRSCSSLMRGTSKSSLPVKVTCWSRSCAAPAPFHFVSLLAWSCCRQHMNMALFILSSSSPHSCFHSVFKFGMNVVCNSRATITH